MSTLKKYWLWAVLAIAAYFILKNKSTLQAIIPTYRNPTGSVPTSADPTSKPIIGPAGPGYITKPETGSTQGSNSAAGSSIPTTVESSVPTEVLKIILKAFQQAGMTATEASYNSWAIKVKSYLADGYTGDEIVAIIVQRLLRVA